MRIFEYHFNPKNEERKIFKVFINEPKGSSEKKLGKLYSFGEIKTDNSGLLDRLFKVIKENFYHNITQGSPEKNLPETLKKANQFLAEEVKKENVGWLGNLNYGIFSIKESDLNFTKTGEMKVLLFRSQKMVDIGKNLEKNEIDPYPLKVFHNVISGKITPYDILIAVSNEIYFFLEEKGILYKIANLEKYDEKSIGEIFSKKLFTEGEGSKISGLCLLFVFDKKEPVQNNFSFKNKLRAPSISSIPSISSMSSLRSLFSVTSIFPFLKKIKVKKNTLIISVFFILLFLGFLIFKKEKPKETEEISSFSEDNSIIEDLQPLFHLEKTRYENDINPLFEFDKEVDKIILQNGSPVAIVFPNIIINPEKEEKTTLSKEFISASRGRNDSFFLSKEGEIFSIDETKEAKVESDFDIIKDYGSNFYLLNKEKCQITRFSLATKEKSDWIKEKKEEQTCLSFAIDGSIWILGDNTIDRYHEGKYQKSIEIPNNVTEIKTGFNSLNIYLLYPKGKRVIIINKEGNLVKQIKSELFEDLRDIEIIEDKFLFVLDNNKIYKIEI